MRALVQRVSRASVRVDGQVTGAIGEGLVVLLGVTHDDDAAAGDRLADKVRALRVFPDAEGGRTSRWATARSCASASSRCTATRAAATGPSYVAAAPPEVAEPLYERFCDRLGAAARRLRRAHGGRSWSTTAR